MDTDLICLSIGLVLVGAVDPVAALGLCPKAAPRGSAPIMVLIVGRADRGWR